MNNISEHDFEGRIRQGYLAELRGDWDTAMDCYYSADFTERELHFERGMAYFDKGKWDKAIVCFEKLLDKTRKADEKYREYHSWLCKAAEQKQATQTFEERIAPYVKKIEKLKAKRPKKFDFDKFLGYDFQVHTEFVAVLALFEEYELLEFCLNEDYVSLNAHFRPQFVYWEPTPLYFITGKYARVKMKDPCKMLRFLANEGANVNVAAGDGSTPLWNQTTINGSSEILKTLLELGANPNQISRDGDGDYTPLAFCLLPNPDENNADNWLPFDNQAIEKAKLLLQHGADPNLACPSLPDLPPLVMAIRYGFGDNNGINPIAVELIELLLEHGADPNFTDSEGNSPLSLAVENKLHDVEKLLLAYGAKMPETKNGKIAKLINIIKENYGGAMVVRPCTAEDLAQCDKDLLELEFPQLPDDYADFLKVCGGYAFDSVELYGTDIVSKPNSDFQLIDVVSATEDFNDRYKDEYLEIEYNLLCFGRQNGDYFTYDHHIGKYQVRYHDCACIDVGGEYDSFEDFFVKEVAGYSGITYEKFPFHLKNTNP